jgi:hypothetical protein
MVWVHFNNTVYELEVWELGASGVGWCSSELKGFLEADAVNIPRPTEQISVNETHFSATHSAYEM